MYSNILTCWILPPVFAVNAFFVEQPISTVISVGENATFSCSAVGFPAPEIVWTRDRVEIQGSGGIEIATMVLDPQTTQSFLTITTGNLTGMYRCRIVTTIEGFPPDVVESNPASITVQSTQSMHHTVDILQVHYLWGC